MAVNIATTRVAAATSTGTQDITISGFGTVKAYLVFASEVTTSGTAVNNATWSYGGTDGTTQRNVWASWQDNVTTTNNERTTSSDEVITLWNYTGGSAVKSEANHDSFITDGVRINWGVNDGSAYLLHFIFFGGSDLSVDLSVGTQTAANGVGQAYTGVGFEPDVVFGISNTGTVDNTPANVGQMTMGIGVNGDMPAMGGTDGALMYSARDSDNISTSDIQNIMYSDAVVMGWNTLNNTSRRLIVDSYDSDGFTLRQEGNSGANTNWAILSLNFGGAADAYIGDFAGPTGTGDLSNTEPGFQPDFLLLFPFGGAAVDTLYSTNADESGIWSVYFTDDTNEYTQGVSGEDNVTTTNTQSYANTGINTRDETGGAHFVGTHSSMDTGGWTINMSTVADTTTRWGQFAIGPPVKANLSSTATIDADGTVTSGEVEGASELTSTATIDAAGTTSVPGATELSSTATLDAAGTTTVPGATELSSTATLDAAATNTNVGLSELSSDATLDAVPRLAGVLQSELSSDATLDAAGTTTVPGATELSSDATLDAVGTTDVLGASELSSDATLDAVGTTSVPGAAELSSDATLDAAGTTTVPGATELSTAATLDAAGTTTVPGATELSTAATLDADGTVEEGTIEGASELSTAATLDAAGTTTVPGASELSSDATLDADGTTDVLGATELSSDATLDADPRLAGALQSELSSDATLDATPSATFAGATELSADATLDASATNTNVGLAELSSAATLDAEGTTVVPAASELASNATLDAAATNTNVGLSELSSTATLDAAGTVLVPALAELVATATLDADLTETGIFPPSFLETIDVRKAAFAIDVRKVEAAAEIRRPADTLPVTYALGSATITS